MLQERGVVRVHPVSILCGETSVVTHIAEKGTGWRSTKREQVVHCGTRETRQIKMVSVNIEKRQIGFASNCPLGMREGEGEQQLMYRE